MATNPLSKSEKLNKEVMEWAVVTLLSRGYRLESNQPENVQITPWSCVVRFITDAGFVYLKQTPELLALEAPITRILYTHFQAPVPEVIAHNNGLNCFLMKDAGKSLRPILKKQFDTALLCKAIDEFTSLQVAVAERLDLFLDIGVPDWRLDKLSNLYQQLLAQKDLLMADGLSEIELSQAKALTPKVSNLCLKLSTYTIKETIVQPDFHDNNTLFNEITQKITLIDLGEIVISHPFFSLLNCLQQAKKHHGLMDEDEAYQQLVNACLNNYSNVESKQNLLDALEVVRVLSPVYGMLAQYRLMTACGQEKIRLFQRGRLSSSVREVITLVAN